MTRPADLLRLIRPGQWVKNAFVFAGVIFGKRFDDPATLVAALAAFAAFCFIASATYVLNDWMDREADRRHPVKRSRPLASGRVSSQAALAAGVICAATGLACAAAAGPEVVVFVSLYGVLNIAYSLRLKHWVLVDVFCIAAGFMLRIIAGTLGLGIAPSQWLLLTGMFATLFLGFAKRRAEWVEGGGDEKRRQVLRHYTTTLLDKFLAMTATGTALCYGLYTVDPKTIAMHQTEGLVYTVPLVLFGLCRYLYLMHSDGTGQNPSVEVFLDPQIVATGVAWALVCAWVLFR